VVLVSTMPSAGPPVNGLLTFTNLGNLGSNQSTNVTVWVRSTVNSGFNSAFGTCSSSVIDPAKANNDNSVKTLVGVPRLQFQLTGNNMVLSWPASLGRYNLQSATNLVPPVTWTVSTNAPVAVGSDYFYTNPAGSGTLFFRLNGPTP